MTTLCTTPPTDSISVTVRGASSLTGLTSTDIRNAIHSGSLQFTRVGRGIVITRSDLRAWLGDLEPAQIAEGTR